MRNGLILSFIIAMAALAGAQSNSVPAESQDIDLTAGGGFYDGNARVVVYYDHVVVTNAQGRLACERLTIHLPPEGAEDSHPTNAVAETNVDIIYVDNNSKTNHLIAAKGIYDYSVVKAVTNATFTFWQATNTSDDGWLTGEPLTYNLQTREFNFGEGVHMHIKGHDSGTNGSPFNLLK
ncbi:MAG: hypothetical protein ABSH48_08325 [Verrucomicrobiota bacterium]|jgi:lipopolysaccharide export system protein LptA